MVDTSPDKEELELVRRATHGDHEAFRCLVIFYEPQLLAYLMQVLGDWEDAYDIAQETFIAAYYALPRWRPMEQARHAVKEGTSEPATSLEQGEREVHPLAPWLYRIATNRALTFLKVLRLVAGERYSEIATTLGLTKEAVRKRVTRGLVALRSVYRSLDTEVSL